MKLTVKTLRGTHFEIRVQHYDTIMAVKKNIEEIRGKDSYPLGQQLLIHNGEVLKDESTLDENQVSEAGFLFVMLSKSKHSASSGASSAQPSSTPVTSQHQNSTSMKIDKNKMVINGDAPARGSAWRRRRASKADDLLKTLARAAERKGRKELRSPGRDHRGTAMKLMVKTLKGSHFEIRVQHNDTIMTVKKNIEEIQGKDSYPLGQQLLIHNGKVLKDESTLDENQVSEDGFLVLMLLKAAKQFSTSNSIGIANNIGRESEASASSGASSAQHSSTPVTSQDQTHTSMRIDKDKIVINGDAPARGSAAAAASLRRRRTTSGAAGGGGGASTMLQFYTDEAAGRKMSPNAVLIMSIGFVAVVAVLVVFSKLYR